MSGNTGNTLKWAFSVIVWTFCGILVSAVLLCFFNKVSLELVEKLIDKLGIPTLFGMIAQSFLHSKEDANKDGIPDLHQEETKKTEEVK